MFLLGRYYLVCISNTILPGVKYEELVGLSISIHEGLQVFLIFFATLVIWAHERLAAACDGGLALRMDPG